MRHALLVSMILCGGSAGAAQAQHQHEHPGAPAPELTAQIEEVRQATAKYRDLAVARAEGFKRFGKMEGPLMGEHWFRKELVGRPLDLTRPSTLQYAVINGEHVLVGVAYTVYQRPEESLPEGFAGSDDHWHVHDVVKLARAASAERPLLRWIVDRRARNDRIGMGNGRTHLVMVHAWVWLDNPDGTFANQHRTLPYLRAGLPAEFAAHADEAAAWGVALLGDGACKVELQRIDFLAQLSRTQKQTLEAQCAAAAARVRRAPRESANELNREAAASWTSYTTTRDATLTAEQRARIASAVEHPMVSHH